MVPHLHLDCMKIFLLLINKTFDQLVILDKKRLERKITVTKTKFK